ncbi:MAG: enoyl-CoA hydratase [Candidatus Binatia bacterium]
MKKLDYILYETPAEHVARIVLNRTETRNSQDTKFLYELNDAFDMAAQDNDIKVIILAANGPHFSSGHDLREPNTGNAMLQYETVGTWCGFTCAGAEAQMSREKEIYIGFSERWRNLPKPTIAAVQGKCIMGGLMLVWPCDIILASDDAEFIDMAVSFGIDGVEYFAHPWELGARKAKEMLFTSDWVTAADAHRLGMVNHVVPRDQLQDAALAMAKKIASKPLFALKLAKEAVNVAEDAQGRVTAMQTSFALHQLAHTHNLKLYNLLLDPTGLPPETAKALGFKGEKK